MDFKINMESLRDLEDNIKIEPFKFQKMAFFYNCIEQGWTIKKQNNSYICTKSHEGKKEVFDDSYLLKFLKSKFDLNEIIS